MADKALLSHLFRRAGFGARPHELTYYAERDYAVAVDDLVGARPLAGESSNAASGTSSPWTDGTSTGPSSTLASIQQTWVQRMLTTTTPLVERMTLFLHNQIATSYRGDNNPGANDLLVQNDLFRSHALGSWSALVHALLTDVAVGLYLDVDSNRAGSINENFARELMERFTLGPGNYTEADVRNGARGLSGFRLVSAVDPTKPSRQLRLDGARHDNGNKTFLGHTGNLGPSDVADIILSQPAATTFLATKLVQAFVQPDVPSGLVAPVADGLRSSGWDLSGALRTIFLSPEFGAAASRRAIVKSPAEFAVGALRALAGTDPAWALGSMSSAGQDLFLPPNVGGWPPNQGWLASDMLLGRYNSAVSLGWLLSEGKLKSPVSGLSIDAWSTALGMTELSDPVRSALENYLSTSRPEGRLPGLVTLLVASPDYALA